MFSLPSLFILDSMIQHYSPENTLNPLAPSSLYFPGKPQPWLDSYAYIPWLHVSSLCVCRKSHNCSDCCTLNFWPQIPGTELTLPDNPTISSVAQSCPTLCDPMYRSTPGLPVHHQLPEFILTHVYRVGDAIQPSHPLSSPSPPAPDPSQHQGLFQWVSSSHEVAKVLEFQLQHQSFQWTPRTDLL